MQQEGTKAVAEVQVTVTYSETEETDVAFTLMLAPYNFLPEGIIGGRQRETKRLVPGTQHFTFNVPCSQTRL